MAHIKTTKYEVPYNWGSGPWKRPPPPGSATGKLSFSITFVNIPIGERFFLLWITLGY